MLHLIIQDYAGGTALPWYGHIRPGSDYYLSNLIIQNFITADLSQNTNHCYLYDERAQDKGADALCSLRLLYHMEDTAEYLKKYGKDCSDRILFLIMDNCVVQNKSKIFFRFFALLSILCYKKIIILFLIPGHSHQFADKIVSWCRRVMKGKNIWTGPMMRDKLDDVKNVHAKFIDHRDDDRPFFTGWSTYLQTYLGEMPKGYTGNYYYEFDEGNVSYLFCLQRVNQKVIIVTYCQLVIQLRIEGVYCQVCSVQK